MEPSYERWDDDELMITDPLAPARGCITGTLLGLVFWLVGLDLYLAVKYGLL